MATTGIITVEKQQVWAYKVNLANNFFQSLRMELVCQGSSLLQLELHVAANR